MQAVSVFFSRSALAFSEKIVPLFVELKLTK